jgi:hypothetical protein
VDSATASPRASRTASPTSVPLNLLDEHFLNLDQERQPWNVQLEVRLGGRGCAERLCGAIGAAARRHPIARARLARWHPWDRAYRWEIADELGEVPLTVVECPEEAPLGDVRERLFAASPSLQAAPPFAVALAHGWRCATCSRSPARSRSRIGSSAARRSP